MPDTPTPPDRPTPPANRPNIVLVLCDDLGYGDVGVLHQNGRREAGRPALHTPNLDAMAAEGAVLEGMYCPAPVCAPSRASLLSGVTQGHCTVRDNAFDHELEDHHTLATVLSAAGYATAAIGKWGLPGVAEDEGARSSWPGDPRRRGFDTFFGYVRHKDGHEHYPKEGLYRGAKQVWWDGVEVSDQLDRCYTTDLFTARAKAWITGQHDHDPDQPFFCYLALDTPHAVTELPTSAYPAGGGRTGGLQWTGVPGAMITTAAGVPDSWIHPDYAEQDWPEVYRRYATSVRRIDDAVGDLRQLLEDLGIAENTLVIFTSDNGPSIESYLPERLSADFFASYGPFDGIKRDCWEGGVRVGAIAWGPGLVAPGRRHTAPHQFCDVLPTLTELAGLPAPARTDGVSLVPLLGGTDPVSGPPVYVEYFEPGVTPSFDDIAVGRRGRRRGQMQLIRLGEHVGVRYDIVDHHTPFEIYDVVADPGQRHDLAADRPDLQRRMADEVLRRRRPHPDAPRPYDDVPVPGLGVPGADVAAGDPEPDREIVEYHRGDWPWVAVPGAGTLIECRDGAAAAGSPVPPDTTLISRSGVVTVAEPGRYAVRLDAVDEALLRLHAIRLLETGPTVPDRGVVEAEIELGIGRHPYRLLSRGARPARVAWRRLA